MQINDIIKEAHETAKLKGWWDEPREDGTLMMLMVSEISEAMEEIRSNKPCVYAYSPTNDTMYISHIDKYKLKPEGAAVELVDCFIRIADYFGHRGWDFEKILKLKMEYNKTRSDRHGGKSF